jgi:uncharacterized DUF497 family protein
MKFKQVLWDFPDTPPPNNRSHILGDGEDHPDRDIWEEDVDEVVLQSHHPHVVVDDYEVQTAGSVERRIDLLGMTAHDRVFFVTIAPRPRQAARPVSARAATDRERDLYERSRKGRKR